MTQLHRDRQQGGHPERRDQRRRAGRWLLDLRQLRREVLAQNPGMPDVTQVLDPATNALPNVYSAVPLEGGWEEGVARSTSSRNSAAPLQHVGTVVADLPSPEADWAGEKYVMENVGYNVVYDAQLRRHPDRLHPERDRHEERRGQGAVHRPDARGLRLGAAEGPGPAELPPRVVLGAATYSHHADPGVRRATGGQRLLSRPERLALPGRGPGARSRPWPPSCTGSTWPRPGSKTDLFTLYGWLSGELFAQALKNAGSDPSRGSILTGAGARSPRSTAATS